MRRREALIVEAGGERFRFYYDLEVRELRHITLRHGTYAEDAVRTFFEGEAGPWDEVRARFETSTETHRLYWTRHAHDGSVIVISCFRTRGGMMAKSRKSLDLKVVAERVEEDEDVSALVSRLEAEADREFATGAVTLRWGRGQIAVVKRAAAILGVPYQTYLKQVVFRQALADIARAETVLGRAHQASDGPRSRSRSS